jgi:phospho-N-acetylmuramoyl-pentapeptide-transferase
MMTLSVLKIIAPAITSFVIGIALTPLVTHYLYKHRAWKKKAGKGVGYGGGTTPVFDALHETKDTGTPRMGGIVIWASVLATTVVFFVAGYFTDSSIIDINFFSRSQTLLPLAALLVGALAGFIDDLLVIRGTGKHFAGGLPLSQRLLVVGTFALFTGWWFYARLGVSLVAIPFYGYLDLGVFFIPFVLLVAVSIYASGVIDGIDGLSGGVFATIFAAYSAIAYSQSQVDLAAFCATITGGILAFLWFNIPPARFYMTETGIMALTMSLTVIAFMSDAIGEGEGVLLLPLIALPLVATVLSDIIQVTSKRFFGRKVFRVAPLHHHFEAIGWPGYKVTMRYWIISIVCAAAGLIISQLS